MGQKCQIVLGDICTPETAEKFAAAAEEWGGLDILVSNAGILDRDGTLQTTPETFDHIIQVNLVSVFRITQKLLQALCESKGCIVNITSSASRALIQREPGLWRVQAGLTALTRQWHWNLRRKAFASMRCNAAPSRRICPRAGRQNTAKR